MASRFEVPVHLLGDHRDSSWDDMSRFVVHFTKDPAVFGEIITTGRLKALSPFGFGSFRKIPEIRERHKSVCLSEVPLDNIDRLVRRHGAYGVAFSKEFIRAHKGARVWYVDQGSQQARALGNSLALLCDARDFNHPLWDLTPFIDFVMPGEYEWDWEREWRVQSELRFTLEDIAFVVTPDGIDELPGQLNFYLHSKHGLLVSASPQPLEEYIEGLVQQFFCTFEDPANCLPFTEGEYVWFVKAWDTDLAVKALFPDLEDRVFEKLVSYLDSVCPTWVCSEELANA